MRLLSPCIKWLKARVTSLYGVSAAFFKRFGACAGAALDSLFAAVGKCVSSVCRRIGRGRTRTNAPAIRKRRTRVRALDSVWIFVSSLVLWLKRRKAVSVAAFLVVVAAVVAPILAFSGDAPIDDPQALAYIQDEGTNAPEAKADKIEGKNSYTAAPTEKPEPTPEPIDLHKGVTDELVIEVQERLMELQYMDYDEPTDFYGEATTAAVSVFQRRNEIDVTGALDREGYELLMSPNARQYMACSGDEGTDVSEIQSRLHELDYMGAITGYFGEDTEAAVKAFQEKNGLTVDGKVGIQTKEMLYSPDAKPNALSYGSTGDDVLKYQKRLQQLGYLTTEPDGSFGKDTVSAVKRFQERNAIVVDGHLGPTTKSVLMSSSAKGNALAYTFSGDDVMNVQLRLSALNYLKGRSVTGYFGEVTEAAVRLFQKNNGLSVDGKVGKVTMNKLFSNDAIKASSPVTSGGGSGGSSGGGGGNNSQGNISTFLSIARSKLGARYVRGGKGPNTFDCSGFVYWCLNRAGVSQSYLTSYQWRYNTRYQRVNSLSNVRAGDILVFYGHVGIALGNGQMIDASSRNGKVVIRSCVTDYWTSSFICAYRVFT